MDGSFGHHAYGLKGLPPDGGMGDGSWRRWRLFLFLLLRLFQAGTTTGTATGAASLVSLRLWLV